MRPHDAAVDHLELVALNQFERDAPTFAAAVAVLDAVRAARAAGVGEILLGQVLRESYVPAQYAGPDCSFCNGSGIDASGECCRGCWGTGCETVSGRSFP